MVQKILNFLKAWVQIINNDLQAAAPFQSNFMFILANKQREQHIEERLNR